MNFGIKSIFKDKNSYSIKRDGFKHVLLSMFVITILAVCIYTFVLDLASLPLILDFIALFIVNAVTFFVIRKMDRIRLVSILYIAFFAYVFLPILTTLGLKGGSSTPFWFMISVVIMAFVLELRDFLWMLLLAFYIDTFFCVKNFIWGYANPVIDDSELFFLGYFFSFVAVAGSLFAILYRNDKNYREVRAEIDKSREIERNVGASKSRFLSNMSNEIRTPMNSIIGMSELSLKEEMSDDARNEMNVIKKSAYELLEIIDDVLMFAKLDSKSINLFNVDFKFDELIKQVIDSTSVTAEGRDIKLRVKIDPNIPRVLNGDDVSIKQIITRLIFISLSLTENGRLMISVDCNLSEDGTRARFTVTVADTGCGLSEVDIDAIRGAYEIYDSRQNSNLKGVSLKFNICQALLEIMGGSLEIHSIEGVGLESVAEFDCSVVESEPMVEILDADNKHILIYTADNRELNSWKVIMEGVRLRPVYVDSYYAFEKALRNADYNYIFVPCEYYNALSSVIHSLAEDDNIYVEAYSKHSYGDFDKCRLIYHPISSLTVNTVLNNQWKAEDYIAKSDDVKYDGSEAKILVVDDNGVNLKLVSGVFKSLNIIVDTAKSGMEALELLKEKEYHLVLMDMVMPEMSGTETLRKMRNCDKSNMKEVPVVALTAISGGNVREEVLNDGFQEYLAKPIKLRYLLQVLVQFLPTGVLKKIVKPKHEEEIPKEVGVKDFARDKGVKTLQSEKSSAEGKGPKEPDKLTGENVSKLSEAINLMDFGETEKLFTRLLKNDFGENLNVKLLSLKEAVDAFNFESARKLIAELKQDAS